MEDDMTTDMAVLYEYGRYLMHGGDPDRFEDMDIDQVHLMYMADIITQKKYTRDVSEMIMKTLSRLFGGAD